MIILMDYHRALFRNLNLNLDWTLLSMDSFLIVSQLSIVKTEFMDNLENEKPGPGWPWPGSNGNLAPPSKGMLQPQKSAPVL